MTTKKRPGASPGRFTATVLQPSTLGHPPSRSLFGPPCRVGRVNKCPGLSVSWFTPKILEPTSYACLYPTAESRTRARERRNKRMSGR